MRLKKSVLVFSSVLVFAAMVLFVSAGFNMGDNDYSIQNYYLQDSYLSGWINISFDETPANYLFIDSLNNNVSIKEVLDLDSTYDYTCDTPDCTSSYSASMKDVIKSFEIDSGETKMLGFKLKDQIESINSLTIKLESNAGNSCSNQVKLDFTNNEDFEISNNKSYTGYCSLRYDDCFDAGYAPPPPGETAVNATKGITGFVIYDPVNILITNTPLCQKIELPEAPEIGIGSWIKETVPGNRQIIMELYNLDDDFVANCTLSKATISSTGKRVVCSTELEIKDSEEYYVCVHTEGTAGEYKTRGYIPEEDACGFIGYPPEEPTSAYDLFAQGLKFDAVGTINIANDFGGSKTLAEIIEDYVIDKYGSLDCSDECLIPINLLSQKSQTVTLSEIKLNYNKIGLGSLEENFIYDFEEIPVKITSEHQKLSLEGLFLISEEPGEVDYTLDLDRTEIIDEQITIEDVEMNVDPTITAAEIPTTFKITITPSKNIKKYKWLFGDGASEITTTSSVEHTYLDIENLTLTVTATQNSTNQEFTKIFDIQVKSPESIIEDKIESLREAINNIRSSLENFDIYTMQRIESILDLDAKEIQLDELEANFTQATTEEEFVEIAKALFELDVPDSILFSSQNEISFYANPYDINVQVLSEITGENYDSYNEQNYIDAISSWSQENFRIRGSTSKISFKYGNVIENALTIFDLRFEKSGSYEPYLIIEDLGDIQMNIEPLERQGYKYLKINPSTNSLKVDTTQDIELSELPAFVSPEISQLSIVNLDSPSPEPGNKKYLLWILIGVLVVGSAIVYIVLQKWYKNKYERSLFKNKNNLYNLANYIHKEKSKGVSNSDIRENLKKAKWNSEQIRYAMRKYSGQNTGMSSLFSFMKKKDNKINKEQKLK